MRTSQVIAVAGSLLVFPANAQAPSNQIDNESRERGTLAITTHLGCKSRDGFHPQFDTKGFYLHVVNKIYETRIMFIP